MLYISSEEQARNRKDRFSSQFVHRDSAGGSDPAEHFQFFQKAQFLMKFKDDFYSQTRRTR